MKNRCVLFLNGLIEDDVFVKKNLKKDDYIIAVDGGLNHILRLEIIPDLILGDFDSSDYQEALQLRGKIKKYNSDKSITDGEIAINYVIEKEFSEAIIFGALGNRIDHMLSNIYMLEKLSDAGINGSIKDNNNEIRFLKDSIVLSKGKYKYFSVIPITSQITGLSIKNARYELHDAVLNRVESVGISNEFLNEIVELTLKTGKALIIKSID